MTELAAMPDCPFCGKQPRPSPAGTRLSEVMVQCWGTEECRRGLIEMERDVWNEAARLREALEEALVTIKALHGPVAWDIYERCSPEMKRLKAALEGAKG